MVLYTGAWRVQLIPGRYTLAHHTTARYAASAAKRTSSLYQATSKVSALGGLTSLTYLPACVLFR